MSLKYFSSGRRQELHLGKRLDNQPVLDDYAHTFYPYADTSIRYFGHPASTPVPGKVCWDQSNFVSKTEVETITGLPLTLEVNNVWPWTDDQEFPDWINYQETELSYLNLITTTEPLQTMVSGIEESIDRQQWLSIEMQNDNLTVGEAIYENYPIYSPSRSFLFFDIPRNTIDPEADGNVIQRATLKLYIYKQAEMMEGGCVAEIFLADPETSSKCNWLDRSRRLSDGISNNVIDSWAGDTVLPNPVHASMPYGHGLPGNQEGGGAIMKTTTQDQNGDDFPYAHPSDGIAFTIPDLSDYDWSLGPYAIVIDVTRLVKYALNNMPVGQDADNQDLIGKIKFLMRAAYWPCFGDNIVTSPSPSSTPEETPPPSPPDTPSPHFIVTAPDVTLGTTTKGKKKTGSKNQGGGEGHGFRSGNNPLPQAPNADRNYGVSLFTKKSPCRIDEFAKVKHSPVERAMDGDSRYLEIQLDAFKDLGFINNFDAGQLHDGVPPYQRAMSTSQGVTQKGESPSFTVPLSPPNTPSPHHVNESPHHSPHDHPHPHEKIHPSPHPTPTTTTRPTPTATNGGRENTPSPDPTWPPQWCYHDDEGIYFEGNSVEALSWATDKLYATYFCSREFHDTGYHPSTEFGTFAEPLKKLEFSTSAVASTMFPDRYWNTVGQHHGWSPDANPSLFGTENFGHAGGGEGHPAEPAYRGVPQAWIVLPTSPSTDWRIDFIDAAQGGINHFPITKSLNLYPNGDNNTGATVEITDDFFVSTSDGGVINLKGTHTVTVCDSIDVPDSCRPDQMPEENDLRKMVRIHFSNTNNYVTSNPVEQHTPIIRYRVCQGNGNDHTEQSLQPHPNFAGEYIHNAGAGNPGIVYLVNYGTTHYMASLFHVDYLGEHGVTNDSLDLVDHPFQYLTSADTTDSSLYSSEQKLKLIVTNNNAGADYNDGDCVIVHSMLTDPTQDPASAWPVQGVPPQILIDYGPLMGPVPLYGYTDGVTDFDTNNQGIYTIKSYGLTSTGLRTMNVGDGDVVVAETRGSDGAGGNVEGFSRMRRITACPSMEVLWSSELEPTFGKPGLVDRLSNTV